MAVVAFKQTKGVYGWRFTHE